MQKFFGAALSFFAIFLFFHQAKAETYFLKIEQADVSSQETFLQTCNPKTAPCTFMIPLALEKGGAKDIAVIMRSKEPPYVYLQFYWDQVLLGTNNFREEYYTLLAGTDPRIIRLYAPIPTGQKPDRSEPVLKFSDTLLATLKVQATMTGE